jgi:plasmid stabilization system protein ParE
MKVIWTDTAATDLTQIVDYIGLDDAEAARRLAKVMYDRIMGLGKMPYQGRKRSDGSRKIVFAPWPYAVVYSVVDEKVLIEAIRHTARNWSE